jgi:chromate transport protein ChrA
MTSLLTRQRTLLTALYPVLAVMIIHQLVEIAITTLPASASEPTWRFGATGFIVSTMPTIATATILILALAAILDHHRTARWVGVWAILVAVIVGLCVVSFGLDAIQVRRMVRTELKANFDDASLKSLAVAALFIPTMLWAGWSAIRATKGAAEQMRGSDDSPPLMVGN